jgi:hypothetical protein
VDEPHRTTFLLKGVAVRGLIQPGPDGLLGRVGRFLKEKIKWGPHLVVDAVRQGPGGAPFVWFKVVSLQAAQTLITARKGLQGTGTHCFEGLSPAEQQQFEALWPLFVAARDAGRPAQFRRATLKPVRPAAT